MLHASTQKLIIKLCELTEAGHIAWKHGDGRTCRFETEGYVVEVQGQPPALRLLHSDGQELERADEPDLAAQPWPDGNGAFATHIALLAARADRIARGAELAISRILSSLSAPPKVAPFDYLASAPWQAGPAPPPAPHTMPGPPPEPIVPDTAIDRVLAVEPGPPRSADHAASGPVIIESETAAVVGDPETAGEAVAETAQESVDPPAQEAPAAEPEPVVIEADAVAIVAAPQPVEPPPPLEPAPEPVPRPGIPRPQNTFGATTSFAKPRAPSSLAASDPSSPKPFSTSPLFFGVNQMSSREPTRAEPEPPPVPPPAAKPVPPAPLVAEKKSQPAIAGPDIYKPWS